MIEIRIRQTFRVQRRQLGKRFLDLLQRRHQLENLIFQVNRQRKELVHLMA